MNSKQITNDLKGVWPAMQKDYKDFVEKSIWEYGEKKYIRGLILGVAIGVLCSIISRVIYSVIN